MPNRNVEGNYRYRFQGQEKDSETGKEAFEARLWDSRIGRWLTIDPAGEFFSPYLGMGNNPISIIDPDGRCTGCPDKAKQGDTFNHPEFGEMKYDDFSGWGVNGASMLDTVMLGGSSGSNVSAIDLVMITPFVLADQFLRKLEGISGSTMYANGFDNLMSRKGDGEVYGTWDFNEMLIPGNIPIKSNSFLRGLQTGVQTISTVNTINNQPLIEPTNADKIKSNIERVYFEFQYP